MNKYILLFVVTILFVSCSFLPESKDAGRKAEINFQIDSIVLPCNISPLNFTIKEKGTGYIVYVHGEKTRKIIIKSSNGNIFFSKNKWKKFLFENREDTIDIDIYAKTEGQWLHYRTIKQYVSADSIDKYIVYRNIGPANMLWNEMSIVQRNLQNYDVSVIIDNRMTGRNCINCHSFNKHNPDQMVFHLRQTPSGTVIKNGNQLKFLNTKTDSTMSAGVYPAWHPSGRYIAFSVNKMFQRFFSQTDKFHEVMDNESDIVLLDLEKNMITTSPALSTKQRENMPVWSPDGKYLYYIEGDPFDDIEYKNNKYNLRRIPFNADSCTWGQPENVLLASKNGYSVSLPSISPNGKWLLFCMADFGYFTIDYSESDIYIMNLETMEYKKLSFNSEYNESYPTWSSNGKWIMFVSKRKDNLYSRPWFCHFENGEISKPFILPQYKPAFYDSYIKHFNRPEFVKEKVTLTPLEIYKLVQNKPQNTWFDKSVDIDALSGATRILKNQKAPNLNK